MACELVTKCRFGQLQQVDVNSVEPAIRAGLNQTLVFQTQLPSLVLCFEIFCGFVCVLLIWNIHERVKLWGFL